VTIRTSVSSLPVSSPDRIQIDRRTIEHTPEHHRNIALLERTGFLAFEACHGGILVGSVELINLIASIDDHEVVRVEPLAESEGEGLLVVCGVANREPALQAFEECLEFFPDKHTEACRLDFRTQAGGVRVVCAHPHQFSVMLVEEIQVKGRLAKYGGQVRKHRVVGK